jgi:hypothetical protein
MSGINLIVTLFLEFEGCYTQTDCDWHNFVRISITQGLTVKENHSLIFCF